MLTKKRVRLFSIKRMCQAFFLVSLTAASSFSYQIITPYWTASIDSALRVRDVYYKSVLPDTSNFSIILLSKAQQDKLCSRLLAAPDSANPWYNFICGALQCNNEKKNPTYYFTTAITLAHTDPGTIWTLFVECTRNRQTLWAERCLMYLEKLYLESGARSVPSISQQLLYYASIAESQKDTANAKSFYGWAERFDQTQDWTILHRVRKSFPGSFLSAISTLTNSLTDSWIIQLAFIANLYKWISCFILVCIITIFLGLSIKYLPKTLHAFADHLPEHIPPFFTTFLPIAIVFSLVSFGLLPFLWMLAFLIWYFLDKKEKTLVLIALFMLVLAPFDARIKDMFLQARMPKGPISLYTHASQEGYSPEVYRCVLGSVKNDPENPLLRLSASLCAEKMGDITYAGACAQKAVSLKPDDPVIATNAGNMAYLAGNFDTAIVYYQKVLAGYPGEQNVRFNMAQSYARKSDTTADLDFIKILPRRDQNRITTFINTNNVYFGRNWPLQRQLLPPEYSPLFFWRHIFPAAASIGSWKTTRSFWGASFFGIPPLDSLAVFFVLFVLIIAWNFFPVAKRSFQKVTSCRLCNRVICVHCKKGDLCASCNLATQYIRNVKTLAAIQTRIRNNRKLVHRLTEYLLDICLPGSGMLYSGRRPLIIVLPIVLLTGVVYASYLLVTSINVAYPHWVLFGTNENLPYLFILYNFIFIIRALSAVFRKKGTVLS